MTTARIKGHQSTLIAIRVLAREYAISPKDHRTWRYSCNVSATLQAQGWRENPGRCKPTEAFMNSFWQPDLAIQLYLTKQESILMSKVFNKTVVPLGSLKKGLAKVKRKDSVTPGTPQMQGGWHLPVRGQAKSITTMFHLQSPAMPPPGIFSFAGATYRDSARWNQLSEIKEIYILLQKKAVFIFLVRDDYCSSQVRKMLKTVSEYWIK